MNETTGVIIAFGLITLFLAGVGLFYASVSSALFAVGTAFFFGLFVAAGLTKS